MININSGFLYPVRWSVPEKKKREEKKEAYVWGRQGQREGDREEG